MSEKLQTLFFPDTVYIGVGDGGAGGTFPEKYSGKVFFGQLLRKILAFFGQKSCKIPGILLTVRAKS